MPIPKPANPISRFLRRARRWRLRVRRDQYAQIQPGELSAAEIHPQSILFMTLDSLRVDVFKEADCPTLKSLGHWYEAKAPASFTYASHLAMFVGVTPSVPKSRKPFINPKAGRIFRIVNSAAGGVRTDYMQLKGRNIIVGMKGLGYKTIGTGAMRWFDPELPSSRTLTRDFDDFFYAKTDVDTQIGYITTQLARVPQQKHFVFMNIGETHIPYHYKGADWDRSDNPCVSFSEDNDRDACQFRQRKCAEFVDRQLTPLLRAFEQAGCTLVICADHGDCHGEDGLWGHGFSHEAVLRVPMMIKLRSRDEHAEHISTANEGVGVDMGAIEEPTKPPK